MSATTIRSNLIYSKNAPTLEDGAQEDKINGINGVFGTISVGETLRLLLVMEDWHGLC